VWGLSSVHYTDDWSAGGDGAPAFALCGLFGMVPVAVGVICLAGRAFVRRDSELHGLLAAGCALGALLATVSLGEGVAVVLSLEPGRVPPGRR
jgi:hypothetical protein